MNIAYFTSVDLYTNSGIRTKHIMQAKAWITLGHRVQFFSIPNKLNYDDPISFPLPIIQYDSKWAFRFKNWPKIPSLFRKLFTVKKIRQDLDEFKPDILYMRSMLWYPGINKIIEGFKVIMEGNTLYKNELKVSGSKLSRLFNAYGEHRICSKLTGVVGVTNEIASYYKEMNKNIETVTIGNGYLLEDVPIESRTPPNNDKPNIIFVGSPGMIWHGVDHFISMAKLFTDFNFHLVGPVTQNSFAHLSNLKQYGYLDKKQLYSLYNVMDIAVGSLGLYRNGMMEGSTLKAKEYIAWGIPTILNHKDIDLIDQEFVLELTSESGFLNKNKEIIKRFIMEWKGKRIPQKTVEPLIDYNTKEKKRIEFFNYIIGANSLN